MQCYLIWVLHWCKSVTDAASKVWGLQKPVGVAESVTLVSDSVFLMLLSNFSSLEIHNFSSFGIKRLKNAGIDDQIYAYLLMSMAAVQAEDVAASFLFVGDLKGHHQEWHGTMTTNHQSCSFSLWNLFWLWSVGCWPNPSMWLNLDLLMALCSYQVEVAVGSPLCNSDHSSILAVILMRIAVPNFSVRRKFSETSS